MNFVSTNFSNMYTVPMSFLPLFLFPTQVSPLPYMEFSLV